jgi:hypothetical protein
MSSSEGVLLIQKSPYHSAKHCGIRNAITANEHSGMNPYCSCSERLLGLPEYSKENKICNGEVLRRFRGCNEKAHYEDTTKLKRNNC